ncbi:MAG: hypothetical protein N2111_09410 [Candidatus Sumerlaeaceae bacterium]|nr:hypothetical protein [Candidatus Sumerlaeaceae bacterium]
MSRPGGWVVALTTGILALLLVVRMTAPAAVRELSLDDIAHLHDYAAQNATRSAAQVVRLPHWQDEAGDSLWRPLPKLLWRATAPLAIRTNTRIHAVVTAGLAAICAALFACTLQAVRSPHRRGWMIVLYACVPLAHLLSADVLLPFVGQADLLAAAGVLAAWLCWSGGGRWRLVLGALCLGAALLSKESAFPAVLVLPLAVAWCGRGAARFRRRRAAAVFVLAVIVAGLRLAAGHALFGGFLLPSGAAGGRLAEGERAVGFFETLGRYAMHIVYPVLPQTDYSFFKQPSTRQAAAATAASAAGVATAAVLAGAAGWLMRSRRPAARRDADALRARREAAAALAWIGLFLMPYLNLVPFGALWAGRFAFLPLFGFAWLLQAAGCLVGRGARWVPPVYAAGLVVAGAWLMPVRAADFRDPRTLWEAEVRRQPDHAFAWKNLAAYLQRDGDLRGALDAVTRATTLWPQFGEAWLARGQIHRAAGDDAAAGFCFDRAAALLPPEHADLLIEQALLAATRRDYAGAARRLERVLGLNPANNRARDLLDRVRRDMATIEP